MVEGVYRVTGMGCASCVKHVQEAVQALVGVEHCDVDLTTEKMIVRYDQSILDFENIKSAVEEAGYGLEQI